MTEHDAMLAKLEDFFCSPKFTSAIGEFMGENVGQLEFVDMDKEQPLKNFDVFNNYNRMIEQQLTDFITAEGLTVQAVVQACASVQETHGHMAAIDYLLATTEYESFMQLAYDHFCMTQYEPEEQTEWDPEAEGAEDGAGGPLLMVRGVGYKGPAGGDAKADG